MTVQELYDWAKKNDVLDEPIAKHFNFNLELVEDVYFLTEDTTKITNMVVLD